MACMSKKIRDDLRSLATASVDQAAFELRARFYFAARRDGTASAADTRGLMREAVSLFAVVKAPVEFTRPTNIVEHPNMAKR
jgi:hypothetical protein